MKKKRLTRDRKMGFQHFPYYQMRIERDNFHGWAALNELTEGEYLYWDFFERAGKVPIAGKGMCWLTLIPDGKKRSVTAIFTEDENVSAWYIDVIYSLSFEGDGVLAFTDQYLDVMLTASGDILTDDRDELDGAYHEGEFTREEYEAALLEGERIIEELGKDIHKTERVCRELLHCVREEAQKSPLTVFLDIDGVPGIFQPGAAENVCGLIRRMNAQPVIISGHRRGGEALDMLLKVFRENNICSSDIIPRGEEYHSAAEAVRAYLNIHPDIERYVFIGNCTGEEYSCDPLLRERSVFADGSKGLQKQDIIKACEILNRLK